MHTDMNTAIETALYQGFEAELARVSGGWFTARIDEDRPELIAIYPDEGEGNTAPGYEPFYIGLDTLPGVIRNLQQLPEWNVSTNDDAGVFETDEDGELAVDDEGIVLGWVQEAIDIHSACADTPDEFTALMMNRKLRWFEAELARVGGGRFQHRNLDGYTEVWGAGHSVRINAADIPDVLELLECQPENSEPATVIGVLNIGNVVYRPATG